MSHPELDNLARIGQLKIQVGTATEIHGLLKSGLSRLRDAGREDLGDDSRFDLAYNAAHALALAALRHYGFRSESRYLVFQCLVHTVGLSNAQWRVLDQAHRKRNLAEYEGEVEVSSELLIALLRVAKELSHRVETLIKPEQIETPPDLT